MVQLAGVAAAVAANEADRGSDENLWPLEAEEKKQKEDDAPKAWIHTVQAEMFFGGWIVLNALVLAIQADHMKDDKAWGWILIECVFNIVFGVEVVLRMMAEKGRWPCSGWNWMDFLLVVIGVIDIPLKFVDGGANVGFLTLLRVFRLLRLLRLVRVLKVLKANKELMLLLQGIGAAIRAMSWGMLLLLLANFILSLLLTKIVGKEMLTGVFDPNLEGEEYLVYDYYFGTLYKSMFTLYMFTMEFQGDTCRDTFPDGPWLTFVLLLWTVLSCFALLGTIGSVIVEAILAISASNHEEDDAEEKEANRTETRSLMFTLYDALDADRTGQLELHDVDLTQESARKLVQKCGIAPQEAGEVFEAVADEKGIVPRDAFVNGMMRLRSDIEAKDLLKLECDIGACANKLDEGIKKQAELLATLESIAKKREV